MLDQARNELELRFTVRTLEFGVIMGRRVEVLIKPVQSLERIVAEVAFISGAIEGTVVGGIGDESARSTRFFNSDGG